MNDDIFAEVDIEVLQGHSSAQSISAPKSMPIAPRTPDPIREKFFAMRTLASQRPFPKTDSELFYKQARFMEDFTDNFEGNTQFNMYYPCYQRMGYDYLRTYFTWRTRVRNGDIRQTSTSYIFLYIYELLSGVGVENPAHGLERLMEVWNAFSKSHVAIEKNLPKWFKDYHVFYELKQSFTQFVFENDLQSYYPLTLLFDTESPGQLTRFNKLSNYDITKSRFYRDGNEEILSKCFDAVIKTIQAFCEEKNTRFEELLIYSVSRRVPWQPFENALFGGKTTPGERSVEISKFERYFFASGQWSANLPIYYSSQKEFIGYIIKKTDACLRMAAGYKYKLAVEMKPGSTSFRELKKPAAKRAELDSVIEKAVRDFYNDMNRVVVTVDHKSLLRIREEALETQEQLIVDEDNVIAAPESQSPVGTTAPGRPLVPESQSPEDPYGIAGHARNDAIPETISFADGWGTLKKLLTDTEKQALALALSTPEKIKQFADEHCIMLEVLIDGINEKASDCIGDSIMELTDEAYVFDEYREYLQKI